MSPLITFSKEDLLRGKVITPGWYRAKVDRVLSKPSKGDNPETTTIFPIEGTIIKNAETGSEEFAGVPTPASWNFNDNPRAKGFIEGFLRSLDYDPNKAIGDRDEVRIDLSAAEGKELEVFIENDTYEGRIVNRINHKYRPVRGE